MLNVLHAGNISLYVMPVFWLLNSFVLSLTGSQVVVDSNVKTNLFLEGALEEPDTIHSSIEASEVVKQ